MIAGLCIERLNARFPPDGKCRRFLVPGFAEQGDDVLAVIPRAKRFAEPREERFRAYTLAARVRFSSGAAEFGCTHDLPNKQRLKPNIPMECGRHSIRVA